MVAEKQEQYQQVLQAAEQLAARDLDWVTFFREVLGVEGIVRKAFPQFEELVEFEKSDEFDAIQHLLVKLREKKSSADSETEPTRVITVRLPKSMHEYLRTEAHDLRTSMNKLCISKLLQMVEQDMIPAEKTAPARRRNTTPAPQPQPTAPAQHTNHQPSGESIGAHRFAAPTSNPTIKTGGF